MIHFPAVRRIVKSCKSSGLACVFRLVICTKKAERCAAIPSTGCGENGNGRRIEDGKQGDTCARRAQGHREHNTQPGNPDQRDCAAGGEADKNGRPALPVRIDPSFLRRKRQDEPHRKHALPDPQGITGYSDPVPQLLYHTKQNALLRTAAFGHEGRQLGRMDPVHPRRYRGNHDRHNSKNTEHQVIARFHDRKSQGKGTETVFKGTGRNPFRQSVLQGRIPRRRARHRTKSRIPLPAPARRSRHPRIPQDRHRTYFSEQGIDTAAETVKRQIHLTPP